MGSADAELAQRGERLRAARDDSGALEQAREVRPRLGHRSGQRPRADTGEEDDRVDVARGEPAGELLRLGALGQARLAERRGARDRRPVAGEHAR